MRCLSCNAALTDYEATRKSVLTNEYTDLCNNCFASVSEYILTVERSDLAHDEDEAKDYDSINNSDMDILLDIDDEVC
jgi:hypothetical protein